MKKIDLVSEIALLIIMICALAGMAGLFLLHLGAELIEAHPELINRIIG